MVKQKLADDLLNLEINAILVDGISSRKAPPVEDLLEEISDKYLGFLRRTRQWTEDKVGSQTPVNALLAGLEFPPSGNSTETFRKLNTVAKGLIAARESASDVNLDREVSNVLRRVERNTDALGKMDLGTPAALVSDQILQIRKIWEIGVERVLMQTVVQMDGDIFSRIQIGREDEDDRVLQEMHRDMVNLAISNWQFMVRTLVDLIESGLNVIR